MRVSGLLLFLSGEVWVLFVVSITFTAVAFFEY